jgi:hypothetical protein
MKSKYEFYEIVKVRAGSVAGLEGAVLGKAQGESGEWYYAIHIYSKEISFSIPEEDLEPTGRFDKRETFYDGTVIKVKVDPKTGEGSISDPNSAL